MCGFNRPGLRSMRRAHFLAPGRTREPLSLRKFRKPVRCAALSCVVTVDFSPCVIVCGVKVRVCDVANQTGVICDSIAHEKTHDLHRGFGLDLVICAG
jgi:hypothetical protein